MVLVGQMGKITSSEIGNVAYQITECHPIITSQFTDIEEWEPHKILFCACWGVFFQKEVVM